MVKKRLGAEQIINRLREVEVMLSNGFMIGKEYDLRVASIPTNHGESVAIRILDRSSVFLGLDKLGLYPDQLSTIRMLMRQPCGFIIVCGPTGCGKTTLL